MVLFEQFLRENIQYLDKTATLIHNIHDDEYNLFGAKLKYGKIQTR